VPDRKKSLESLRTLIFEVAPGIKETTHYNLPTYELEEVVVAMASQKHYMSLYLDVDLVDKYKNELSHLNCGKSCVRFKKNTDLPLDTIKTILKGTLQKQTS
jgi:uncharacterized protein YdhG (YjbR/CyaY superfamily)